MNNEIKYGLYSGLAFSIWVMMEFTTGLHNNHMDVAQYSEMCAMFIPWIFIFTGIRNRKNSLQNGRLSFGEGVRAGLLISLVSSCLIAGFLYVYVNAINTGYSFARLDFIQSKLLEE